MDIPLAKSVSNNKKRKEGMAMLILNLAEYNKKLSIEEVAHQYVIIKEYDAAGDTIHEKMLPVENFRKIIFS